MTAPRIDVHQHVIPPECRRLLAERGRDAGGWNVPPWDEVAALAMMDARGIAAGRLARRRTRRGRTRQRRAAVPPARGSVTP